MTEYCGPFVVRIITGQTEERIRRRINRYRGKKNRDSRVVGTYKSELICALQTFGARVGKSYINGHAPTLHAFIH